jgi:hypothetical protein
LPKAIAAGMSRLGTEAARKTCWAIGARTKKATKRLTPPNVTIAPPRTTASTARLCPNFRIIASAIAETDPVSSISFPNKAPSRTSRKNRARNCEALTMKVPVRSRQLPTRSRQA